MRLYVVDQFQGALVGAAIAERLLAEYSLQRSNLTSINDKESWTTDSAIQQSQPVHIDDNESRLSRLLIDVSFDLIASELGEAVVQDYAKSLDGMSCYFNRETSSFNERVLNGNGLIPIIALIPFILYMHHDVTDTHGLSAYLQACRLDERHSGLIQRPLTAIDQVVIKTFQVILNQQFCPETYLPTLLDELRGDTQSEVLVAVILAVQHAISDRRGAWWLLQSFQTMQSCFEDRFPSQSQSRSPSSNQSSNATSSNAVMTYSLDEAIAIGWVLYCFLMSPSHYNMALSHLNRLIQKSALENTQSMSLEWL